MKCPLNSMWYDFWEMILGENFMKANYIRYSPVKYKK